MKTTKRRTISPLVLAGGLASLVALPTAHGLMEVGPGVIIAEVEGRVSYDSNIFTSNRDEGDTIFAVTPTLAYEQNRGLIKMRADVGYELLRYVHNSEQNTENLRATLMLAGGMQANAKTNFSLNGGYFDTKTANVEAADIVELEEIAIGGDIDWAFSQKLGLRTGLQYRDLDYKNFGLIDSETLTYNLGALWFYSEKLTLSSGYRYREISYASNDRDIKTNTFFVGAEGTLTPKVTGTARLGVSDYSSGRGTSLFYELGLDYSLSSKSSLSLVGARDNSASVTGDNNEDTSLTLAYNQVLTERLSSFVSVGWGTFKRDGDLARDDEFYRFAVGLNATVNEYVSLRGGFSVETRDSNSAFSDYERTQAYVAASFRF